MTTLVDDDTVSHDLGQSSRLSKWQRLPVELVGEIFSSLAIILDQEIQTFAQSKSTEFKGLLPPGVLTIRRPAFQSLPYVCWNWYPMATKCLYRDIYISSYAALGSLVKTLTNPENTLLPPVVRTFVMANDIFSQPYVGYTEEGMENLQTIYRVCPNLCACPLDLQGAHEILPSLAERYETNWCNATRLEVHFPLTGITGHRPFLGPISELPLLQELIIYAEHLSGVDVSGDEYYEITLPEMPQLRRLSISGWHTNKERLKFPRCPLLYVLELIGCTISPGKLGSILPGIDTLESLVITGLIGHDTSKFRLDLTHMLKLSYLCVPLRLYLFDGYLSTRPFPPYLRHLVLTDEFAQMWEDEMELVEIKLLKYMGKITACHLKIVQIFASSPYKWKDVRELAEAAGVEFQVLSYDYASGKPENAQLGLPSAVTAINPHSTYSCDSDARIYDQSS